MVIKPAASGILLFLLMGKIPGIAQALGDEGINVVFSIVLGSVEYMKIAGKVRTKLDSYPQEPRELIQLTRKAVESELALAS